MKNTGIFRKRKCSYSIISNDILDNINISPQAFYIYSKICRYITIDNFVLTKGFVLLKSGMSENTFDKYWKELLNEGYLKIYQMPDVENNGKWLTEYELLEEADLEIPYFIIYKANGEISKQLFPKSKSKLNDTKDYKKSYGNVKNKIENIKKAVPPKIPGREKAYDGEIEGLINTNKINTNKINTNKSSSLDEDDYKTLFNKCNEKGLKITLKQINKLMSLYEPMKVLRIIEKCFEVIDSGNEIKRSYNYIAASIENTMKENIVNININKEEKKIGFNNYTQRERTQKEYDDLENKLLGWDS